MASRSTISNGVRAKRILPEIGRSNFALAVQVHILKRYSIVKIPTEKISKITEKSMNCKDNPLIVSKISVTIFREIRVVLKCRKFCWVNRLEWLSLKFQRFVS